MNLDTAVPLGLIISELIINSMKHAYEAVDFPELDIRLTHIEDDQLKMVIRDNGVGLPNGFDLANGGSLGSEIIQSLTDQIEAKIEYWNDNGAVFQIIFSEMPNMTLHN